MTKRFDPNAVLGVFERLAEYVSSDPTLSGLSPPSQVLLRQARQISEGQFDIEVLADQSTLSRLPSRESVQRIISIMAPLPSLEPTAGPSLTAAYAALLAGLAANITHLIYRDFPDLVPRR